FEALRTALRFDPDPFRLLLTVLATVAATLSVTVLTPPEEPVTLRAFYRRVRPGGLWGRVAREVAAGNDPPSSHGRAGALVTLAACSAACVLVIGATAAIGDIVLARAGEAMMPALPAFAALGVLVWLTRSGRLGIIRG
ncbi:MAG: hypothetical protein ACRELB_08325, partial [Polyangiaceae bacterium]